MSSRVVRCMEIMFCGWVAFAVAIYYEVHSVQVAVTGGPSPLIMVPPVIVALGALCVPANLTVHPDWHVAALRLKSAALITLGLCPFFPWHLHSQRNLYLTVGGGVSLLALVWLVMEILTVQALLFGKGQQPALKQSAMWARQLTAYILFTPLLTIYAFTLGQMVKDPLVSIDSLGYIWRGLPSMIRYAIVGVAAVPVLAVFLLTWAAAGCSREPLLKVADE